ncbi:hypothetical protein [Leptolyngbya ohadii]|uniref:hypothetical protein n=1 Tax=Leptolyngbya ohadii TaxID=1962290 RepID=UPI00117A04F2|nr:hypothetical protein [Leptolyngbya ohadii]
MVSRHRMHLNPIAECIPAHCRIGAAVVRGICGFEQGQRPSVGFGSISIGCPAVGIEDSQQGDDRCNETVYLLPANGTLNHFLKTL